MSASLARPIEPRGCLLCTRKWTFARRLALVTSPYEAEVWLCQRSQVLLNCAIL